MVKPNPDGNIHTVPTNGKPHEESENCWCEPLLTFVHHETLIKHYLHKGYEELEQ